VSRWDPFADSFRILERFGGRFRDGWPREHDLHGGDEEDGAATPAADVFEDREGLHIEVELPGVAARDVALTLSAGTLVVEAERCFARTNAKEVVALEGRYGRMRRSFTLPLRAEPERALAELRQGVLRIFVPRAPEGARVTRALEIGDDEAPRAIEIN
jgi:HSP20 family protein